MIEKIAKALREAQIQTGVTITPNDAILLHYNHEYLEYDEILGFKTMVCPSVTGWTFAVNDINKFGKLIRIFEDSF